MTAVLKFLRLLGCFVRENLSGAGLFSANLGLNFCGDWQNRVLVSVGTGRCAEVSFPRACFAQSILWWLVVVVHNHFWHSGSGEREKRESNSHKFLSVAFLKNEYF